MPSQAHDWKIKNFKSILPLIVTNITAKFHNIWSITTKFIEENRKTCFFPHLLPNFEESLLLEGTGHSKAPLSNKGPRELSDNWPNTPLDMGTKIQDPLAIRRPRLANSIVLLGIPSSCDRRSIVTSCDNCT